MSVKITLVCVAIGRLPLKVSLMTVTSFKLARYTGLIVNVKSSLIPVFSTLSSKISSVSPLLVSSEPFEPDLKVTYWTLSFNILRCNLYNSDPSFAFTPGIKGLTANLCIAIAGKYLFFIEPNKCNLYIGKNCLTVFGSIVSPLTIFWYKLSCSIDHPLPLTLCNIL